MINQAAHVPKETDLSHTRSLEIKVIFLEALKDWIPD